MNNFLLYYLAAFLVAVVAVLLLWHLSRKVNRAAVEQRRSVESPIPTQEPMISRNSTERSLSAAQSSFDAPPEPSFEELSETTAEPSEQAERTAAETFPEPAATATELAAELAKDDFPAFSSDILLEEFHLCAWLKADGSPIPGLLLRDMAADILKKVKLKKRQTMLGHSERSWETVLTEGKYRYALWAVPLRSNSVFLTTEEYASIGMTIRYWMRQANGRADIPPLAEIEEAQEWIRQFSEKINLDIDIFLIASTRDGASSQTCGRIIEIASAHGLEEIQGQLLRIERGEQQFHLCCTTGDQLGSLSPDRPIASLWISMKVANLIRPRQTYEEMIDFARNLSRVLNFRMVDADNNDIDEEHIAMGLEKVQEIAAELAELRVKAGSELARALFG